VRRVQGTGQGDRVALGIGDDGKARAPEGVLGRLLWSGAGGGELVVEAVDRGSVGDLEAQHHAAVSAPPFVPPRREGHAVKLDVGRVVTRGAAVVGGPFRMPDDYRQPESFVERRAAVRRPVVLGNDSAWWWRPLMLESPRALVDHRGGAAVDAKVRPVEVIGAGA